MHLCIAGGSEPSLGEGSGDSEQTDEDGDLDVEAQAQPLNSKVSPPLALSLSPNPTPLLPVLMPLSSLIPPPSQPIAQGPAFLPYSHPRPT